MNKFSMEEVFAEISVKLIENGAIRIDAIRNKGQQLRVRKLLDANKAESVEASVTEEKPSEAEKEVKEVE